MDLAGFGAILFLREDLINRTISTLHDGYGSHFRTETAFSVYLPEFGTLAASGAMYLTTPEVTLQDRTDESVGVNLTAYSRVRVLHSGTDIADVVLRVDARVLAPISLSLVQPTFFDEIIVDLSTFTVDSASIHILDAPVELNLETRAILLDDATRDVLVDKLRPLAQNFLRVSVPLKSLTNLYLAVTARTFGSMPYLYPHAIRPLNGVLAIGFDQRDLFGDFKTAGRASDIALLWPQYDAGVDSIWALEHDNQILDHSDKLDLLLAIDAGLLNAVMKIALVPNIVLAAASNSLHVNASRTSAVVQNSGVGIVLDGTVNAPDPLPGQVHFHVTLDGRILYEPGGFRLLARNINVSADYSLGLGILDATFVPAIVELIVQAIADGKIMGAIDGGIGALPAVDLTYVGDVPNLPAPDVDFSVPEVVIEVEGVVLDPTCVMVGATATVTVDSLYDSLTSLYRDYSQQVRDYSKEVNVLWGERYLSFDYPLTISPEVQRDPSLRIRLTGGGILATWWADVGGAPATADCWTDPNWWPQTDTVLTYTVTRGGAEALLPLSVGVRVNDLLDWHHPYFHDSRIVRWFRWEIHNGKNTPVFVNEKLRRGAIHKTKLFDRCEFSAKRTSDAHRLEYLDVLPPTGAPDPPDAFFSNRLCPYCFDIIPKRRGQRYRGGRILTRAVKQKFLTGVVRQNK